MCSPLLIFTLQWQLFISMEMSGPEGTAKKSCLVQVICGVNIKNGFLISWYPTANIIRLT